LFFTARPQQQINNTHSNIPFMEPNQLRFALWGWSHC